MMMRSVLLFGALTLAAPLAAQTSFSMPQGCEAYVTIQKRSCSVSHLFRCEMDPEGHQRRVDLDQDGLTYMGLIDSETQWIESYYPFTGETATLVPSPADPANFTELLATGRDGMDFQTQSDLFGLTRYVGEDRLTGQTVVIDGVTLDRTAFNITVTDSSGATLWTIAGNEFIHAEWRTFISGTRSFTTPDAVTEEDGTPVEFIFPGEDGFLSSNPRFDCDVVMSEAEPMLSPLPASFEGNW
jgi:hypothetical protein